MKNLLILGGGTAGTLMLNKLHKKLDRREWNLTIVDKDENHYYQPGFLFIPFGTYTKEQVVRKKRDFFPKGIEPIFAEVDQIQAEDNQVLLTDGRTLQYDILIVATGIRSNLELGEAIGLETNRGIVVNSQMETNLPHVYAAGDGAGSPVR